MPAQDLFDPINEAGKIAFDRLGNGKPVLLISGFPQTQFVMEKADLASVSKLRNHCG